MRPLCHNYSVMAMSGLPNAGEQFYFFATIPYIPLSYTLVIVTYYWRHLVASCNLHIILEAVCDNSTGEIFTFEFDFRVILNYP